HPSPAYTARRPDQHPDAADRAEHHRQIPQRVRRLASQQIVIERRDASGGEAQRKAVESEMMIELATIGRAVVLVEAAGATAVEITQLAGIANGLKQSGRIGLHADGLADIAPER